MRGNNSEHVFLIKQEALRKQGIVNAQLIIQIKNPFQNKDKS